MEVPLQLEQILASKRFANAERMSRFLRFAVGYTLANRAAELKLFVIGVEVFHRTADNDPVEQQANQPEAASFMILTIVSSTSCATASSCGTLNIARRAVGFKVASVVLPPSS